PRLTCSRSTRRYRCSQSRTSSPSSKPIPASTILLPQEPGHRDISSANCSACRSAWTLRIYPFNSAGLAIGPTVAVHPPIAFTAPPPVVPQVKEGKLRALAVASKTRLQALPDVPTMAEAGYPDIEGEVWFAVIVPARTPKEIIALLHAEIV